MNRSTLALGALLAAIFAFVVLVFFLGLGGEKSYASPEDVFDAARSAMKKDDVASWCQCLTEESRDLFAVNGIVKAVKEKKIFELSDKDSHKTLVRALDEALAKHGLTPTFLAKLEGESAVLENPVASPEEKNRFVQKLLAPIQDRNEFIQDLHKAMLKAPEPENFLKLWKDAKLSDVKIQGDTAQGKVSYKEDDLEPPSSLQFRNQNAGWRIDLNARPKQPEFRHP